MTQAPSQSSPGEMEQQKGTAHGKFWLIATLVLIVVIIGVAAFILTRPSGPPASWVAKADVQGQKMVYFLYWERDNDQLDGYMELAIYNPGVKDIQVTQYFFTGTYNSQDQVVTLVFDENAGVNIGTLTGKIENNSLTLRSVENNKKAEPAAPFSPGTGNDYAMAKEELVK